MSHFVVLQEPEFVGKPDDAVLAEKMGDAPTEVVAFCRRRIEQARKMPKQPGEFWAVSVSY